MGEPRHISEIIKEVLPIIYPENWTKKEGRKTSENVLKV